MLRITSPLKEDRHDPRPRRAARHPAGPSRPARCRPDPRGSVGRRGEVRQPSHLGQQGEVRQPPRLGQLEQEEVVRQLAASFDAG
nr:hypothetical protein [Micromonospora qiuiae]